MTPGNKIVINTLVQYVRSIVYMLLTLFSTRFVLDALGHSAYGVYALVGSVVYMAGFLTQSLATSTQRFLSYSHGLSDKEELLKAKDEIHELNKKITKISQVIIIKI